MPSESNENRPITPGETESRSSHAHLPPPIIRDLVIRSHLDGIFQRYDLIKREVQMAGGRFTSDEDAVIQSHLYGIFRRYDLIKKVEFTPDDQHNEEMNRRFQDREEIHGKMSHPRPPPDQTNKAPYCLVFLSNVKDRIYANDLVTAENGDLIQVAICDMFTQAVITTDCSLSSARVILTVLDAKFSENKGETWSWSEFNQNVLRGRNGKGSILTGPRLTIQLKNGVGTFENIFFNDNSSWLKDSSIRLAVMVEGEEGYLNGKRVQEGVSKPFRVLDRRSKVSEKLKRLNLIDNVQSIVKIGTLRADILKQYNIITVENFLWGYFNCQPQLRQILNQSESSIVWRSMVDHVMQCADEYHAKNNPSNNSSHPQQHANVESGNILTGDSVQRTNVGGFPPMEGCGGFDNPCSGRNDGGGAWF